MHRKLVCCVLIAVLTAPVFAADQQAAMLFVNGNVLLNGGAVPGSSVIMPGDLVQSSAESLATINANGSNVVILANSVASFQGDAVSVAHGSVRVATSKRMATNAENVTITPTSDAWTEFEVTDTDETIQIAARKGDLTIDDGSQISTLPEGQQATIEKKKKRRKGAAAIPAGGGALLTSPLAMWIGAGAVGGIIIWVLWQGGDPMSDDTPPSSP